LNDILEETMVTAVHRAATMSVGSEISLEDMQNIIELCDQVMESTAYRDELTDYIKHRMQAIAPNLTVLVGELVGAKLIARAGSLVNLAKHPASTVQIIGAEKALFRALKAKKNTPKYGIIYNASLVGHATLKNKGKISRVLANKTVLSARVDALGDDNTKPIGMQNYEKIKLRLKQLEGESIRIDEPVQILEKYETPQEVSTYNPSDDIVMGGTNQDNIEKKSKKRKRKTDPNEDVPKETVETTEATEMKEDDAPIKKRKKSTSSKKKKGGNGEEQ